MADIKTILRELSVIIGIGLAREEKELDIFSPSEFIALSEKFCENIKNNYDELVKVKSLKKFDTSCSKIIENGIILGRHIYQKLKIEGEIHWTGKKVGLGYPYDITIDDKGFSLKEGSYILKNPAFSDYLNALVQPEKPFKKIHVFRHFASVEFETWFGYTYSQLINTASTVKDDPIIFSYNKYFIKRIGDELVFERKRDTKKVCIPINSQVSEYEFNKDIPNDVVEHTFSKWIRENLEKKDERYLTLKRKCSEAAGRKLKDYVNSNYNPDTGRILEILQIYENDYYYGKCVDGIPLLFKVPSRNKCEITSISIEYSVPESQLNVLFAFEILIRLNRHSKINEIKMHVECRYSHGQFNGIPEAKLYCKDKLDKLYEPESCVII